jgi:hypothetical protein
MVIRKTGYAVAIPTSGSIDFQKNNFTAFHYNGLKKNQSHPPSQN